MDKAKLNYLLDAVIGVAFAISAGTGMAFMLMGTGGYQGGRNAGFATGLLGLERAVWSDVHTLASLVMIAGAALHIALHWRWIVCITKKMLPSLQRRTPETVCEVIS